MQKALEVLEEDDMQPNKARSETRGFIKKMELLETAVMTIIWSSIMESLNKIKKILQAVDIDLGVTYFVLNTRLDFITKLHELDSGPIYSRVAKLVNLYPNDIDSFL